jgi:hypothetical protein
VLAITCSSSATSTLGFTADAAVDVDSAMLIFPKIESQSSVCHATFTGYGFCFTYTVMIR